MQKLPKTKKIIILIVVLLLLLLVIMAKKGVLEKINIPLFKQQQELFSYVILDNQNENKVIILANIHTENGIEYIEKGDGTIIHPNNRKDLAIDYAIPMNQEIQVKIKETGKDVVTKTVVANNNTIENMGLKINTDYQINGYKVLEVEKSNNFLDGYNELTYQVGQNGTWIDYNDKFPVIDYDVLANNLDNNDNTVTITAKLRNPTTSNEIILKKTYNVITTLENQTITSDSILKAVEGITQTGTYNITVSDQTYQARVYCFNEDMDINVDTAFGTDNDVSTGEYAKNMIIVKVDGDLSINDSVLTSYANKNGYGGPKGMLIYCTGDITNDGTISMTARGARAVGQDVYMWKNANDASYEYIPAVGGAGGQGGQSINPLPGENGKDGINRQTGGGASGYAWADPYWGPAQSGNGSAGTSYSGGTGGGGADSGKVYGVIAGNGEENGCAGGYGSGNPAAVVGGAGNPGGSSTGGLKSGNGTGGLLIIYANNVNNEGSITSQGTSVTTGGNRGGGSGGGSINIFYNNTYNDTGIINVDGGTGGATGGDGTISVGKIVNGTYEENVITADMIYFTPDDENWNVDNVKDALDYLFDIYNI